jgi:hypothetical protein
VELDWSPDQDELRGRARSIVADILPPGWTARYRDVATPERLAVTMRLCERLAAKTCGYRTGQPPTAGAMPRRGSRSSSARSFGAPASREARST